MGLTYSRKYIIKFIRYLLTVILLFFIGAYLIKNKEVIEKLKSLSPASFFLLSVIWIIAYLATGYRLKLLLSAFKIKTNFAEWFGTTVASTMSNYLVPFSGLLVKGGYFNLKKRLGVTSLIALEVMNYALLFLTRGFLGMVLIPFIRMKYEYSVVLEGAFFFSFILGSLPLLFKKLTLSGNSNLSRIINNVTVQIRIVTDNRKIFVQLILLNILSSFIYAFWYFLAFKAINIEVTILSAFVFGLILNIIMFVPITPGNIGVQELALAVFAAQGGIGYDNGLASSIILRGVSIVMSIAAGLIFVRILTSDKSLKTEIHK